MFANVLSEDRITLLARLTDYNLLHRLYMAGGTAAALQLGHRKSEDFDFFSDQLHPETLANSLAAREPFQISSSTAGSLHGFINNVKISFLLYPYPLLFATQTFMGVPLADIKDIALMKIVAIANRGTNKDFVDLYYICKTEISLEELLLDLFAKKYSGHQYSLYHILRSLQFFEDAEKSPPLEMIYTVDWEHIKSFFMQETDQLAIKILPQDSL
ncbi:MAG: nucleotidyl transferase AbiEii/AbiGii toxin family protein [Clostridiales bacterium]|nr:nucleotidyl transferase AbiEii/AbiGii toxin family protein [Clostridiales bacterium]